MATNPMQRKARVSFLLGVLITLIIAAIVISLLFLQLKKLREEQQAEEAKKVQVLVLKKDVKSGDEVDISDTTTVTVSKDGVPSNALKSFPEGEKDDSVFISKVDLYKNMVLTDNLLTESDNPITDDLRKMEYNVFVLPTQLESDEYIELRFSLPSGQDYIVISKKKVEIPEIGDGPDDDNILINLNESEILTVNCAIVESAKIPGSKLYVARYVEPGLQKVATPTYIPSAEIIEEIHDDPNIVVDAKNTIIGRYQNNENLVRNKGIQPALNSNAENADDDVQTKVTESITNTKEDRKKYLDSLSSAN